MDIIFNICEHTACHLPNLQLLQKNVPYGLAATGRIILLSSNLSYSSIIAITTLTTSSVLGLEK